MKTIVVKALALLMLPGMITLAGCEKSKNDVCSETNWENAEDPIFVIRATLGKTEFVYDNVTYTISQASNIKYTGTITKYYCSGQESSSFEFNTTFYPENGYIQLLMVKIGGPFQFLFQNDRDNVKVEARVRLEFPDGAVFRPKASTTSVFYFKNIYLNANEMEYYVMLNFENLEYEKVSY